ncbi:hypothetical protein [Hymenobacter cellulosivorans]|uniref:Uncharacterized protein n=1 Tax=Hymenobacter cellulosivorans TaxID=2932249 RepID=A0ABY4F3M2_9BACT|nr:hypothetical protein [Hymenobacter cellulosivorans]UOQ51165.1 hypothetical protein MUN80_15495 [Hymenobacter cellulosivorans]
MLSINQHIITFTGKPVREVGTVRFSPSFRLAVEDVRLIGRAPRLVVDDESSFIVLVDKTQAIHYFNTDLVASDTLAQLEQLFGFSFRNDTSAYTYEQYTQGITEVVYPASLRGKPLFKRWSWFSPRGLLKNVGYALGMDNPKWERMTAEVKTNIEW